MLWGQSVMHVQRREKRMEFEDVSAALSHTECTNMVVSLRQLHTLFASLGTAAVCHTHHCRRRLHGIVAAFPLSVFSSVFTPGS